MRSARRARPVSLAIQSAFVWLVLVGGLAGCRTGSPLHRRYDNFRAYYNTFYNAERKLEEGEEALLNVDTPVDRSRLVELFPTGSTSGTRAPAFEEAIEKSAELLRRRPGSRWADDALLVIGKAYFYERNLVGAEQKFRETTAAAELVEDRGLADEARFWLGRTLGAADRYDEGVSVLRQALEMPDGDRYWQARMHLALGELYARAGRWDDAAASLREGLPATSDADLGARGALLLGQVEEAAGRYDAAADAYQDAVRRQPAYEIAFAAALNRALVMGLDGGRAPEATEVLRDMSRDDKNYARRADVALAQARVLTASGDPDGARTRFRDVLYDPDLAGQNLRGEAHYRLAEFYRDALGDYVTAAAHFDTAATALPAALTAAERPSRAALTGVREAATTYGTVSRASTRIVAVDSLLALGKLDEDAFRARIAEIEAIRREQWVQQLREADAIRTEQNFNAADDLRLPGGGEVPRGGLSDGSERSSGDIAAASTAETGFLGFRDPRTVQAGLIAFQRIFADRPLVPNWRRRSAVQGGPIAAGVGLGADEAEVGVVGQSGPPLLDLSSVPRTPEQQEALLTERATLRYELANAFFLSLGRADRASVLYRQILDETPDAPVAARARYALAELEAGAGRTGEAAVLYREVVRADSLGSLGRAARARLDGQEPEATTLAFDRQTEVDYTSARSLWDGGNPLAAAVALVALGESDPDGEGAPRTFLAAALAYTEWTRADSTALVAPLPPAMVPVSMFTGAPALPQENPDAIEDALLEDDLEEEADALLREEMDDQARIQAPDSRRDRRPAQPAVPVPATPDVDDRPLQPGAPLPVGQEDAEVGMDDVEPLLDDGLLPADSLLIDTTVADSTAGAAPTLTSPETSLDSLSAPPPVTLRDYLVALATRYPGTPHAVRARDMADALPRPPALRDTLAVPTDPAVELEAEPGLETPERVQLPPPTFAETMAGFAGSAPIDPDAGGVTWRFGPFETLDQANSRLGTPLEAGLRAAVATDETSFYLLVGQFADDEAAARAGELLPSYLLKGGTVASVSGLIVLVDEDARSGETSAE